MLSPVTSLRSRGKATLLFVGALSVVALFVWPGCATAPLPAKRTPVAARKQQDFAFLKTGQVSRSEMVARVGPPDEYFEDLRVACYRVNEVARRRLWLFLGVLPVGANTDYWAGEIEVAFLQFDEQDQARRFGMAMAGTLHAPKGLHGQAQDWLAGNLEASPRK